MKCLNDVDRNALNEKTLKHFNTNPKLPIYSSAGSQDGNISLKVIIVIKNRMNERLTSWQN